MTRKIQLLAALLLLTLITIDSAEAACTYQEAVKAKEFQVGIMLTWKTDTEEDHERFIVEKSDDGMTFTEIGTVTGKGTTYDVQDYNFLHVYPQTNRLFYRLKEIAFDGTVSYSDIVIFAAEKIAPIRIVRLSKSFTSDDFTVKLDSYTTGALSYTLKTWKGEILMSETLQLENGLRDVTVDLRDAPVGIYKLALALEDKPFDVLTFKKTEEKGEEKIPTARKN